MADQWDDAARDDELADVYPVAVRAVKTGEVTTLRQLLREHPALANARSTQGRTLLNHVCDWPGNFPRELETARLLLAVGANINARAIDPESGETSLQWAASSNDTAMIRLLVESGASANGLHDDCRPLAQALYYRCRDAAELLVRLGAVVTLEFAAGLGRLDLMPRFFGEDGRLLDNAGQHVAPINRAIPPRHAEDERLEQALIYAVINDELEGAAYLLDRGADPDAMPSGFHFLGASLHWAAGGSSLAMAELLVRHGADPNARTPNGDKTPLDIAQDRKRDDIAGFLGRLLSGGERS